MHQAAAQPQPAIVPPPARTREVRKFVTTAVAFCAGLVVVVFAIDALLGWRNAQTHGKRIIGRDVRESIDAARRPGPRVRTLYLGDSVTRQLFHPGEEPRDDVRYVTSNFAIALAGQYYLLEDALRSCPNAREINLIMVVGAWGNDLDSVFTDDYFCGYFHSRSQVAEVFHLKRDWRLSTVHASRWLLPNLLAHNAARRPQAPLAGFASPAPAPAQPGHPADPWLTPAAGEPLLNLLARGWPPIPPPAPRPPDRPVPPGSVAIPVSRVSHHYLARMRALCQARGVRLRILPGPCPDTYRFTDTQHLYDADILYVDPAKFSDGVHIRPEYLDEVRAELLRRFQPESPRRHGDTEAR